MSALLLVACGARLTDEQRELAIHGAQGVGTGQAAGAQGSSREEAAANGAAANGAAAPSRADGSDVGSDGREEVSGPRPDDAAGEPESPSGDSTGTDGADTREPTDGNDGAASWQSVPEGGNGGATDVGVTEDRIRLANVSDLSGPVPGLFEDAQLATAAYVAHHNATEGPIYGRQLDLLPLDSRMDSGANRQQFLRACDEAFASVGSMSGFEEGAVDPIQGCGLPDVRPTTGSQQMQTVDHIYSILAQQPGFTWATEYRYWREEHPDAIKNAAFLFIDVETTRFRSGQTRAATQQLGYEWTYVQPVQAAETNYTGFVLDMQEAGVEFVTFQGDHSQVVRLVNAMRRQNWWPEVFALQTNVYTPAYIAGGGSAVEGTEVAVTTALLEEMDDNEELQRYDDWLQQVDPSADPTSMGMLAWSAAKLTVQAIKDVGPELTRQALIEELEGVRGWTGGGLHGEQHVGTKEMQGCVTVVRVEDGAFRRVTPEAGFRCEDPVRIG